MAKCVFSILLISVAYIADNYSLSINSKLNASETCAENETCTHGAVCKAIGNYNFCECREGTNGHRCQNVTGCDFKNVTCREGSGAQCGFNVNLNVTECLCDGDMKYDTETEACRETCVDNKICTNGAVCQAIGNYKFCECREGTNGHRCQNVIGCDFENVTCREGSGAQCGFNVNMNVTECLCDGGMKYDTETEACRDFTTPKEVSTISLSTCDEEIDDCENGAECIRIGDYHFCNCLNGTHGDKCEHIWDCDELNNRKCNYWKGEMCIYNTTTEESECLCIENGLYYDNERKICRTTCDRKIYGCVNGAECTQIGDYHFCNCLNGTYGDKCERIWDCDELNYRKCNYWNGEICIYNTTTEESECLCFENGLYYDTERKICRKTCNPENHDCKNGAICKNIGSYDFCKCLPGTSGDRCESVRDCKFIGCSNSSGAWCEYNINLEIAECLCENGLKYDENRYMCREICNPENHDCQNGAACEKGGNYSFCNCPTSTYGHKCEIVEDCESQKVSCSEDSGARCGLNLNLGIVECICENGLAYNVKTYTCRETCNLWNLSSGCENGGICNSIGNHYFCDCPPGTSGHRCEKVKDKHEDSPLLLILLCIVSGFLLVSTITLVAVFKKFRSERSEK